MFSKFFKRKEPPVLKPEMLQPIDTPISTADAKQLFKEWMVRIGHFSDKDPLDRLELSAHAGYMIDEMKEHEGLLREEVRDAKESVADAVKEEKDELRELKKLLAKCNDPSEKSEIEAEIADCEYRIAKFPNDWLAPRVKALADFKADKREFLVHYINMQVHGAQWREKL
ncbi:MAG TPA: hypothetical protein PLR37_08895 [Candidatus Accumulibacter phosphatis]|nr:hypothetical protein [Candidatus Accumulibacter phosphatis]